MDIEVRFLLTETIRQIRNNIAHNLDNSQLFIIALNEIKNNQTKVNIVTKVFILLLKNDLYEINLIKAYLKVKIKII
jgi:hypothetical protein